MRPLSIALLLAATTMCAAEPNTLTAKEKAAGWKLCFDGYSARIATMPRKASALACCRNGAGVPFAQPPTIDLLLRLR